MCDDFGWDKELTKKIWCFGPDTNGPNLFLDTCKGVQVRPQKGKLVRPCLLHL